MFCAAAAAVARCTLVLCTRPPSTVAAAAAAAFFPFLFLYLLLPILCWSWLAFFSGAAVGAAGCSYDYIALLALVMLQLVWTLLLLLLSDFLLHQNKAAGLQIVGERAKERERFVGPGNLDVDVSSDLAVRGGAGTSCSSSSTSYVLLWTVRKGMVAGAAFCGDC